MLLLELECKVFECANRLLLGGRYKLEVEGMLAKQFRELRQVECYLGRLLWHVGLQLDGAHELAALRCPGTIEHHLYATVDTTGNQVQRQSQVLLALDFAEVKVLVAHNRTVGQPCVQLLSESVSGFSWDRD